MPLLRDARGIRHFTLRTLAVTYPRPRHSVWREGRVTIREYFPTQSAPAMVKTRLTTRTVYRLSNAFGVFALRDDGCRGGRSP